MSPYWYRHLDAAGQGPDWRISATFTEPEVLAALVRAHAPAEFVREAADQTGGAEQPAAVSYLDAHSHASVAAAPHQNRWVYHSIAVRGGSLTVERGYGGYPGQHGEAETELLVALARHPRLTLVAWAIAYGGDGYPLVEAAGGRDAASLLAYLGA